MAVVLPANRPLIRPLICHNKENIKTPHNWPFSGSENGSVMRKAFTCDDIVYFYEQELWKVTHPQQAAHDQYTNLKDTKPYLVDHFVHCIVYSVFFVFWNQVWNKESTPLNDESFHFIVTDGIDGCHHNNRLVRPMTTKLASWKLLVLSERCHDSRSPFTNMV